MSQYKIEVIENTSGEKVFPVTHPSAVRYTDGSSVDTKVQGAVSQAASAASTASSAMARVQAQDATIAGKYSKPSSGIPKSDMAADVQASLGKADTALQSHQSLSAYRTASAQNTIDATKASASDLTQLSSKLGNLSNLTTTEKSNLVGAINELRSNIISSINASY